MPEISDADLKVLNDAKTERDGLKTKHAEFEAKHLEYENKIKELSKKPDPKDDPDLKEKARIERESADKKTAETKALERALTFNLKSKDFLKTNESLLPKDVADIFAQAEKENYASAVEKDGAIKAGMIQSFFAVQENADLLTPGLKTSLDEYLKLTKTEKQTRAQSTYEAIFEPAFEMLKRVKKAEQLNRGFNSEDDFDVAYKNKLMKLSNETHLRERK